MWAIYGFRDAYNPTVNYISSIFMGLNQGPIVVMIENFRSGLLWSLFMSNPEIEPMLARISFVPDEENGGTDERNTCTCARTQCRRR
jgi:exo beta-1,2-glucooligosaccharide sophorohydrolase (non-reducing end)